MEYLCENIINENWTIRQALEKLNTLGSSTNLSLFVVNNNNQLVATLTDGDIRRSLLAGKSLSDQVEDVMFRDFRYLRDGEKHYKSIKQFRKDEIELVPLLDQDDCIIEIIDLTRICSILPIDAVIMAGGQGIRLRPLTAELPKPMLEIGGKPIMEHSINLLKRYGISNINISVNYLAHKIESYFGNGEDRAIKINYVHEDEELGTIGGVSLVQEFHNEYILVMNSDLLTNINLEAMFVLLMETGADMAVATIPYNVKVPYATLQLDQGRVKSLKEKPTETYYTNAGIYLMKKEMLNHIPNHTYFNATDFISKLVEKKKKIISFQILGYWLDIGKPEDFEKAHEDIKSLKL